MSNGPKPPRVVEVSDWSKPIRLPGGAKCIGLCVRNGVLYAVSKSRIYKVVRRLSRKRGPR